MTLSEFNSLDLKNQLEITWEKGIIEDTVTFGALYYILYKVDDFLVEIASRVDSNEILHVQGFT
jgi:hypothetical protein